MTVPTNAEPPVVHAAPPAGFGLTLCCLLTPAEVPQTDRMAPDGPDVTCPGVQA